MVKKAFGYLLVCSVPGFAQPGTYDTIPVKLVADPDTMVVYIPYAFSSPLYVGSTYYLGPTSSSVTTDLYSGITVTLAWWTPACGDTYYYDDGTLASRVECVDSVP